MIRCVAIDGEIVAEIGHRSQRRARRQGGELRSPFYDVVLHGPSGAEVLSSHVPSMELLAQLVAEDERGGA